MLDFAQYLVSSTDLSVLSASTTNYTSNFHSHIADLHPYINMDLIAQQYNQNVLADFGRGWDSFVKSGQIWALLIGAIVGYLFRSITNT